MNPSYFDKSPHNFLQTQDLQRVAPSVFTNHAYEKTTDRYTIIPTHGLLKILAQQGFGVTHAMQSRSRKEGKKEHTKHLLRLRHVDAEPIGSDETYPELVLINGSGGDTSIQMLSGLIRFACSNGLIVSDGNFGSLKLRHTGDIEQEVVEGALEIVKTIPQVAEKVELFQTIELTRGEQNLFCDSAAAMRWGRNKDTNKIEHPLYGTDQLNTTRRRDDKGDSLWNTYNRIQENLLKGGLRGRTYNEETCRHRRTTTRQVKSVDADSKINRELVALADQMAKLKG